MKKEFQAGTKDQQRKEADNSTSASVEANPMLSDAFLAPLDWWQIYKIAEPLVSGISDKELYVKLLEIFPIKNGEEYIGSLCNHYRGRLKNEGKFALINQMCKNSLKRLIKGLSVGIR